MAVFTLFASEHVLAEMPGDFLEAIADAEDGDGEVEDCGVDVGGVGLVHGVRASGEDDTFRLPGKVGDFLGTW